MRTFKGRISRTVSSNSTWYSEIPNYKDMVLEVKDDIADSNYYVVVNNDYNRKVIYDASPSLRDESYDVGYYIKKINFELLENGCNNEDFKGLLEKENI